VNFPAPKDIDFRLKFWSQKALLKNLRIKIFIFIFLGLKLASKKFPDGLITGSLPASIASVNLKEMKILKLQKVNIGNPLSNYLIYQSGIPANKTSFEPSDIEKLEAYLDQNLIPDDAGSRLSRTTSTNSMSTRSNVPSSASTTISNATSIQSKPWK
jgi:centrosomal protein CEP41